MVLVGSQEEEAVDIEMTDFHVGEEVVVETTDGEVLVCWRGDGVRNNRLFLLDKRQPTVML